MFLVNMSRLFLFKTKKVLQILICFKLFLGEFGHKQTKYGKIKAVNFRID